MRPGDLLLKLEDTVYLRWMAAHKMKEAICSLAVASGARLSHLSFGSQVERNSQSALDKASRLTGA